MTRYHLAKILVSAALRFDRDIQIFSAGSGKFSARGQHVRQWSVPAYTDNESSDIIANEGNKGCKNPDKYLNIQVTG